MQYDCIVTLTFDMSSVPLILIPEGDYNEIARTDINITNRLGIGEFGPIYDAELQLDVNDIQRVLIKVATKVYLHSLGPTTIICS